MAPILRPCLESSLDAAQGSSSISGTVTPAPPFMSDIFAGLQRRSFQVQSKKWDARRGETGDE